MKIFKEFKEFINRGSVMDLAVAVIIGAAFGKIVTSLVNDIVMPVIGLILGGMNLTAQKVVIRAATDTVPEAALTYGNFIQALIDFLLVALVIFLLVKTLNTVSTRLKKKQEVVPPPPPVPTKEELLLTDIRNLLAEIKDKKDM
jgi:large conductance mechanosensitive channel